MYVVSLGFLLLFFILFIAREPLLTYRATLLQSPGTVFIVPLNLNMISRNVPGCTTPASCPCPSASGIQSFMVSMFRESIALIAGNVESYHSSSTLSLSVCVLYRLGIHGSKLVRLLRAGGRPTPGWGLRPPLRPEPCELMAGPCHLLACGPLARGEYCRQAVDVWLPTTDVFYLDCVIWSLITYYSVLLFCRERFMN